MKKALIIATFLIFAGGGLYALFHDESGLTVAPPNPVDGLITSVTQNSISLRTSSGVEYTFVNRAQDVSVAHLKEHQSDKEPVSITWHAEGNKRIATSIGDAP